MTIDIELHTRRYGRTGVLRSRAVGLGLRPFGKQELRYKRIQLFQKTLSKEKLKAHKPRLQGKMGIFATSKQCLQHMTKISGGV